MARNQTPKESPTNSPVEDSPTSVSLLGNYATPEPPAYSPEIVVGAVPESASVKEQPKPTVSTDKDGNITIK